MRWLPFPLFFSFSSLTWFITRLLIFLSFSCRDAQSQNLSFSFSQRSLHSLLHQTFWMVSKNGRRKVHEDVMIVDASQFRSFVFRGEGRANIVISAKHRVTGNRLVWRFAKTRKSGQLSLKGKSVVVGEFMEKMVFNCIESCNVLIPFSVSPLLNSHFLVRPRTVEMSVEDVHLLAKIPSLQTNTKVEDLSELEMVPSCLSLLPLSSIPQGISTITCLEMLDATCIPKRLALLSHRPTVTMEIKPKQGYFQNHPGIDLPYCNNCILQIEKSRGKGATYERMYDFCPLSLFSTQIQKQRKALESLLEEPHRNLRIFVDGNVIMSEDVVPDRKKLEEVIFPQCDGCLDDLIDGLLGVLNGNGGSDGETRSLSLLEQLVNGQRMDVLGVVRAHELFFSLSTQEQAEVGRKVQSKEGLSFLQEDSSVALLKRFFLGATLKDCSVMISLRLLDESSKDEQDIITLPSGKMFAYSAKIVDLDPKSPKNMVSAYRRLMEGASLLREDPSIRPPCITD